MALVYDMMDLLELKSTLEKLDALFIKITGGGLGDVVLSHYMLKIDLLIEEKESLQ